MDLDYLVDLVRSRVTHRCLWEDRERIASHKSLYIYVVLWIFLPGGPGVNRGKNVYICISTLRTDLCLR